MFTEKSFENSRFEFENYEFARRGKQFERSEAEILAACPTWSFLFDFQ
jgi:hypothetical protein